MRYAIQDQTKLSLRRLLCLRLELELPEAAEVPEVAPVLCQPGEPLSLALSLLSLEEDDRPLSLCDCP